MFFSIYAHLCMLESEKQRKMECENEIIQPTPNALQFEITDQEEQSVPNTVRHESIIYMTNFCKKKDKKRHIRDRTDVIVW